MWPNGCLIVFFLMCDVWLASYLFEKDMLIYFFIEEHVFIFYFDMAQRSRLSMLMILYFFEMYKSNWSHHNKIDREKMLALIEICLRFLYYYKKFLSLFWLLLFRLLFRQKTSVCLNGKETS